MIHPTFVSLGLHQLLKRKVILWKIKNYGYQFQMVQLIVRKTQKVEAVKEEKQPLNELQTKQGSV
jgi:hypothetical protein